ncbi:uncharacterized protein LOC132193666 [Neocloeon triangulifer]|uniref:uncharacterized protein LOC132193666 n=1 Tax=Neocloeon triangulifer TaxID=2078957 RepID=UPI00286F4126|nr:uncharacterized protein LOC132193666 [Neocloeon triangulifer]
MFLCPDKPFHLNRTVLICNLISGYCLLPRCRSSSRWRRTFSVLQECYELTLNVAIFVLTSGVAWVVLTGSRDNQATFATLVNSIRGVLFATYICFSSLFLKFGKKQLLKIFRETTRVANLDRFKHLQSQCLARSSQRTFCVYFLLPLLAAYVSVIMNVFLTVMVVCGYYEDNVFNSVNEGDPKIYTSIEPLRYIRILVFLVFCYTKQASHDAIFLHLYCFVAEELKVLKRSLRQVVRENQQILQISTDPAVPMAINIENWVDFQQILARLMRKINSFAYPYVIVMAGYNAGILCITAYLFSKLTDSPAFKLAVFGYMMNSIIRISLFCEAGHRLRKEGLAICDVIYKAPILRSTPSLGLALHSVALDCQRSFVARGGPFFTLSVEFFTSVAGAVLTYFVVLIQFK